ncbi:NupC/NupG family nucleoside CNT transporter [Shewanella sp. NIFS-20-20]|uniref:NupC/NupG family nucleoside CNT transporter n=1 Tax=Shewanella sp. NIFS-20-20 TaxID=2853806 RepID=UPI001C43914D|nr:NupC/NupG family nucleoside CNT transporter [Shewanella sp. NIFS-20-20]MBV7316548.1 NupC/NupG family nucleoside CNT transporter [Shewanella sp. NIFS-20-20]
MQLLISLIGMISLISIAWALSEQRQRINWRTIMAAFGLQTLFAAIALYIPAGERALVSLSNGVAHILSFADEGIRFLFGDMPYNGFIFAFRVLPLVIFISALISLFYYLGVIQWLIKIIGGAIQKLLGTSKAESLAATGNIFLSQGETPLLIRPFLPHMTRSELFTIMTCGMASVAGSVIGGYAALGIELKYLIAASFMAAPGSILMAKMLVPETKVQVEQSAIDLDKSEHSNAIDALASGAMNGTRVAVAIGTVLMAFISVIAMTNAGLEYLGEFMGWQGLTMQTLLGYVFAPIAFLIGVPSTDMQLAGSLIGQKLVLNEFVAYLNFSDIRAELSAQTQVIMAFALCGFANFCSIAIQIGSIGVLAPERRGEIAGLGLKAVLAATLANLMSAALAGLFFNL